MMKKNLSSFPSTRFFVAASFFLLLGVVLAQSNYITTPRDTSYTSKSALKKINKNYPDAELVYPVEELNLITHKNIEYADYDGRKLYLDLFSPKENKKKKLPLVILIHGGGWVSGDRSMLRPLAQQIAEDGFNSAAIEYRLGPESLYPSAVNDILTSIKWLKYNCDKYNIDSGKVALLGTSAGGHLAALVATTWDNELYNTPDSLKHISAKVQAVVDIDGVLDLTHPAESGKDTNEAKPSVLKRWLGLTYLENPDLWKQASPVNYIIGNTPPTLFINSSIPRFHAGRDVMITKMNQYKNYSEVYTFENSPHSFWLFNPWFKPTKKYIIIFLNKIFTSSHSRDNYNEK